MKVLSLRGMVFPYTVCICSCRLDDAAGRHIQASVDYGPLFKLLTLHTVKLVVKLN